MSVNFQNFQILSSEPKSLSSTVYQGEGTVQLPNTDRISLWDFRYEIALKLAAVPGVLAVYATEYDRGKVMFIWTIVSERQDSLYRNVYKSEAEIVDSYRNIQFEFTVVPSQGKDPRLVIVDSAAALIYVAPSENRRLC
jgi:hypothetical protein